MTNPRLFLCQISFAILVGCAGHHPKPTLLKDAEKYNNEGVQAFLAAHRQRAERLFGRALRLYQSIDDQQGILRTYINLIEVALSARDFQTAQKYLARASRMVQSGELKIYQNRIRLLSSQLAMQLHRFSEAEQLLQPLLPEFSRTHTDSVPDPVQLAAIANRTRIAFAQQLNAALWTQRYADALTVTKSEAPDLEGRLLRFQAALLQQESRYEEAANKLKQALVRYKAALLQSGIAATLSELGQLYLQQRRWQQAQHYLYRAVTVLGYRGDLDRIINNTEMLAQTEAELGNTERSRRIREWLATIKKEASEKRGYFTPIPANPDFLSD